MLGNASVLEQNVLEHPSPMASGGIYSNGGANNKWPSPFQSEVWTLTINITFLWSNSLLY